MINKIYEILSDVSLSKKNGKFLADKSYGFDTLFFISKFIKHHNINRCFNKDVLRAKAINYIEDIFQLKLGTAGAVNYFLETINLLEYSNVIKKTSNKTYFIQYYDVLDFIADQPENAYIFIYLVTYMTFVNDKIMYLYKQFCDTENINQKIIILKKFHMLFCDKSVSIEDMGESNWSKQLVKYAFIVLGYINKQNLVTRTLNIKDQLISINDISLNVKGTRTPIYLPKKNDYLKKFNNDYVLYYLKPYLLIRSKVTNIKNINLISSLAQNLADLKLFMQDDIVDGKALNEEEKQQYIVTNIKIRNQAIQRQFRKGLLDNNDHKCPICGFSFENFLLASHIKPYSKCDDTYDAINHYNGFLMCPNHDKLFEGAKYMTIDYKSGKIILSDIAKNSSDFRYLQNKSIPLIYIQNERRHYLRWHNEQFYLINNG